MANEKVFKERYGAKLEFLAGGGCKPKQPSVGVWTSFATAHFGITGIEVVTTLSGADLGLFFFQISSLNSHEISLNIYSYLLLRGTQFYHQEFAGEEQGYFQTRHLHKKGISKTLGIWYIALKQRGT